jgi:hypothetical protein
MIEMKGCQDMINLIDGKDVVNIGPLECSASCILTILNSFQLDPSYFLLNYWYLNYSKKILMGSKSIRNYNLDFLYNIHLDMRIGDQEDLIFDICNGRMVMLMCKASSLSFYPRSYLAAENLI